MRSNTYYDPRSKLALAVSFVFAGFLTASIRGEIVLFGFLTVLVAILGPVELREWLLTLLPLGVLVAMLIALNSFFYASGPAWFEVPLGPVRLALTPEGVTRAVFIAVRLVVVASAAIWFALGTETERFEAALTQSGVPFSFAFMLSLTIGLLPELRTRFRTIEESQRSRGVDLSGGPISRIRARVPMLLPFLVATIRSGYELSMALSARGFDEPGPRTSITTVHHGLADVGLYLIAIGVGIGTFILL